VSAFMATAQRSISPSAQVTTPASIQSTSTPGFIPAETPRAKGKRKADEVDTTPPEAKKEREQRATFAVGPRPVRPSNATTTTSGHAPSSYHRQKRARLSASSESPSLSRSLAYQETDQHGSWPSRRSTGAARPLSRSQSVQSHAQTAGGASSHRAPSRRSLSQASIPLSALISPHAPSVARSGGAYHMRDPHKPPRIQPTAWALSWGEINWRAEKADRWRHWTEAGGSPLHAWLFFIGFVIFPIWWVAAFIPVVRTRRIGEGGKDVILDDPQLEFDARTWRKRSRIMAVVSFVTYIPFIILVAIFA
ncbi:unnamed protein product, partial [Mycena citricolor]